MNDCPLKDKVCNFADEMYPHYKNGNYLLKEDYRLIQKFIDEKGAKDDE